MKCSLTDFLFVLAALREGSEIGKAHVGTLPPLHEVGHTVFAVIYELNASGL